jgi:FixJ family two-component response regulator
MIAVVDDEECVGKAIVRLLRALGYSAQAFISGADFLRNWPANKPDCLLLDLQMPGLPGIEVQRALNRAGALVPVVILTAYESPSSRAECMREGAIAYLCKPIEDRALLDALKLANLAPTDKLAAGKESSSCVVVSDSPRKSVALREFPTDGPKPVIRDRLIGGSIRDRQSRATTRH